MRAIVFTILLAGFLLSSGLTDAASFRQLTSGPSTEADPCFSPDGQRIVYLKDDNFTGARGIWIMPVSGESSAFELVNQKLDPVWPVWSPDGSTIVFVAMDGLMKVPAAGGPPVRLTWQGGRHPTWSPDGSRIAFASDMTNDIWVVPAAGGGASLLIGRSLYPELDPAFSPDGDRIAFSSAESGHFEIFVQSITGGAPTQLTAMGGANVEPAWSPDGQWIAFSRVSASEQGIWIVPAAGGTPFCLTCQGYQDGTPSWSPDGRSIVFDRHKSDNNDDIWLVTNLPLQPTILKETTWGRVKALFR